MGISNLNIKIMGSKIWSITQLSSTYFDNFDHHAYIINSLSYLNSRHLINDILIKLNETLFYYQPITFLDLIDDTLLHFLCFVRVFPCSSRLG